MLKPSNKFYQSGSKSRAICETCNGLVTTTFGYHNLPFSDGKGIAKNILAASCDFCGEVVAIPAQSTSTIIKSRNND